MKAMILAAGRGERMRPLTDHLPKPLLEVGGKPLIVHHLEKLSAIGVVDVVINIAYLGSKIRQTLGDGSQWGVSIEYSEEPEPLETGGALLQALPLLGTAPFLLINGDVWSDISLQTLSQQTLGESMGRLVFVQNPEHNALGDFALSAGKVLVKDDAKPAYTFSGVALMCSKIITHYPDCRRIFPLREVFNYFIQRNQLDGELYQGQWCDVGTPQRLHMLNQTLSV